MDKIKHGLIKMKQLDFMKDQKINIKRKKEVIKSVYNSDLDILLAISHLYLNGKPFELDPCYSKGSFYKGMNTPKYKLDKNPQTKETIKNDIIKNGLPFETNTINSIIFDPPFLFGTHGKQNIMEKRFTIFDTWNDLKCMYKKTLNESYRILNKKGILAFKCQDYTDSKTTITHCFVYNWAIEQGFKVEDLFILINNKSCIWNPNLTQRHARKFHSYWYVFKK